MIFLQVNKYNCKKMDKMHPENKHYAIKFDAVENLEQPVKSAFFEKRITEKWRPYLRSNDVFQK